jgi:hypothetical protein
MLDLSHLSGEATTSPSPRPKIISWCIRIDYEDGTTKNLAELPNEVAETVDRHLDSLE